jgi:hypothetical protein
VLHTLGLFLLCPHRFMPSSWLWSSLGLCSGSSSSGKDDPRGARFAEAPDLSRSSCSNGRRRDTVGLFSDAIDSPERLLRLASPSYPAAGFTAMVASSGFSGECLPPPIALFVDVSGTVGTKTISTVAEPPLCRSPKAHSTALWR